MSNEVPLQLPPALEAMIEYSAALDCAPSSRMAPPLEVLRPTVAKISETSLPVLPSDAIAPPDSGAWLPAIVELLTFTVAALLTEPAL